MLQKRRPAQNRHRDERIFMSKKSKPSKPMRRTPLSREQLLPIAPGKARTLFAEKPSGAGRAAAGTWQC
jgi:hypothetical protein